MRSTQCRIPAIVTFALFAALCAVPSFAFADEAALPDIASGDGAVLSQDAVGAGEDAAATSATDQISLPPDADSAAEPVGSEADAGQSANEASQDSPQPAESSAGEAGEANSAPEDGQAVLTTGSEKAEAERSEVGQLEAETPAIPSQSATSGAEALAATPTATASFTRIAGSTALDTMKLIVQKGWSSSKAVVIASSKSYQDTLSASALAGSLSAPILLTDPSTLSAQTKSEISRLKATIAYIVGGSKAVSEAVDAQLKGMGIKTVVRVKGKTAEDTAIAVANQIGSSRSKTFIVATGGGYQDALAIAPYAYKTKAPIFLTSGNGKGLSSATCDAIATGGYTSAVIVGGVKAVGSGVESQIKASGVSSITRLRDATAEGTSVAIANWVLGKGMKATYVGIATSTGFQDALAGAALCGKLNAPLVLVCDGNRTAITNFINKKRSSISTGYIFGGRAVISEEMGVHIKTGTVKSAYRNLAGYQIGNYTKLGIDVSRWQGVIDWTKVKAAGIDFAIIGAGYWKSSSNYLIDPYFVQNVKGAKAAGVDIGVYLYSYGKTTSAAKGEANHVLNALKAAGAKPADLKYGIYYDLEEPSMSSTAYSSTLLNMAKTFASTLNSAGYNNIGVYANYWWWSTFLTSSDYNKYSRWVAQYNTKCYYAGSYKMWQFTSTGSVSGISTNVDMNLYYG